MVASKIPKPRRWSGGIDAADVNLAAAWSIAAIFLTIGGMLMLNMTLERGDIGYVEGSFSASEWLNESWSYYNEYYQYPYWFINASEGGYNIGYYISDSYRSFLVPVRLVVAVAFLLVGLYAMPIRQRRHRRGNHGDCLCQ